jgi:endonuclease YncB( thermonuclease family)
MPGIPQLSMASPQTRGYLYQELFKEGWCWWYRKYAPGDTVLEGLEDQARQARKGLWADPQPVPPWERRKKSR